ncbi:hypothetical protein ACET8S_08350 [Aeromonas veronii]
MPFFSKTTLGFYNDKALAPEDAVEISEKRRCDLIDNQSKTSGSRITADAEGMPMLTIQPLPELTNHQIEMLRLHAYADPVTGSDRFFVEALRMEAMGEVGWEALREKAIARCQEIKLQYPWMTN